jgi:large subunit ribosomal protein L35
MPKIKTKRAAAKRLRMTANGLLKRGKAFRSHILTKKSTKRKRGLRQTAYLTGADAKNMKRILPYL